MLQGKNHTEHSMKRTRKTCLSGAMVILAIFALTFGTACNEEEALKTFRDAASESLQSGIKTITDGIIDGLFAVFQSNTDTTSGDTTTTTP